MSYEHIKTNNYFYIFIIFFDRFYLLSAFDAEPFSIAAIHRQNSFRVIFIICLCLLLNTPSSDNAEWIPWHVWLEAQILWLLCHLCASVALKYSENSIYNIFNSLTCRSVYRFLLCVCFSCFEEHIAMFRTICQSSTTRARSNFNGCLTTTVNFEIIKSST